MIKEYVLTLSMMTSILSFVLMAYDKRNAKKRKQRVPESSFVVLSLMGGGFGVLIAALIFSHKTIKKTFQIKVGSAILVHLLLAYIIIDKVML